MVRRQKDGWETWGHWVLATIVGGAVGSALGLAVAMTMGMAIATRGTSDAAIAISGATGGVIFGVVVGIGQWLILRYHFERAGWWILATALGGTVGWAIGMAVVMTGSAIVNRIIANPGIALIVVMGTMFGIVVGIGQWLVLRQHFGRAGWWILATALGGIAGTAVVWAALGTGGWAVVVAWAWVAGMVIGMVLGGSGVAFLVVAWAVVGAVVGALFSTAYGIFSGAALVWSLRRRSVPTPYISTKRDKHSNGTPL